MRLSEFESSFPSFFTPGMKGDDAGCKARMSNFRGESFLPPIPAIYDIPTYYVWSHRKRAPSLSLVLVNQQSQQ